MSNSTNSSAPPDITSLLPPSLNLPPHLSAHKYFFVCTLTVAAWDTLVLSPRTWRLWKTKEWPPLKWAFFFLRIIMPVEFTIVAVAFFDTHWSRDMCEHFFLFEPIVTAIMVSVCSLVHLIRIRAIFDKNAAITAGLGALFAVQVVVMAVACGFYHVVPVADPSQGCIAGPKHNWVGIYWVAPTAFFTTTLALALTRSFSSLQTKSLSLWKLMLRDGLNLYAAVWIVNMVNMLFWFVARPTGPEDTIKTIVTSMAAVLTATMTMRIILSVRGSLVDGGSFAGASSSTHASSSGGAGAGAARSHPSGLTPARSAAMGNQSHVYSINPAAPRQTYTLDEMRSKAWLEDGDLAEGDKSSLGDAKMGVLQEGENGVKVMTTVERNFD